MVLNKNSICVALTLLALLCASCAEKQPENHGKHGDDGLKPLGNWVYRDTKTGCEWIGFGEHITPRIDASGKQVCEVKP